MKVIAGEKKGRKLNAPKGDLIRPTPDKVKGAIFNILQGKVENKVVIDLFAGSGALGIEALSRGAEKVFFGDFDKASVNLVKKNLEHLGYTDEAEVIFGDFKDVLAEIKTKVDIVLLDPPYYKGFYGELLEALSESDIVTQSTIIVVERDTWNEIPEKDGKLKKTDSRKYGKTSIDIYAKQ
jgi:16S rRNA (guanine(966)-N(2))-methyltransferase RsmD